MATHEQIEKTRQGIMRFRELLDIMQIELQKGEKAYEQFFANCSEEDKATLKEKDLQWQAALDIVDDPKPLREAALHQRFRSRDLERAFEELHDHFVIEESGN